MSVCCDFDGPMVLGDAAAVITIRAGSPGYVSGIVINAEGCSCGYSDIYSDVYCDVTEAGAFPNATITDTEYTLDDLPPNSILIIDAAERTVRLTDSSGRAQIADVSALDWVGLFEWIEAAKGGCQRVCVSVDGATLNTDTTAAIDTHRREL